MKTQINLMPKQSPKLESDTENDNVLVPKLNDENETCNRCGRPTVPLFHAGRKRWCPKCEGTQPHTEKDAPAITNNNDDEITLPLDWSDIFNDPVKWS